MMKLLGKEQAGRAFNTRSAALGLFTPLVASLALAACGGKSNLVHGFPNIKTGSAALVEDGTVVYGAGNKEVNLKLKNYIPPTGPHRLLAIVLGAAKCPSTEVAASVSVGSDAEHPGNILGHFGVYCGSTGSDVLELPASNPGYKASSLLVQVETSQPGLRWEVAAQEVQPGFNSFY